jgi:hypothetical protein
MRPTVPHRRARRGELLARVLGAAGPELSCDQCFAELDRYVDLRLAGADADAAVPGMRAHLRGCGACADERELLERFLSQRRSGAT